MSFTLAAILVIWTQQDRVFDPKLDKDCVTIEAKAGYEIHCPDRYDYDRAEYVRRLSPIKFPGHSSDGSVINPENTEPYPNDCKAALKNFYERAAQFAHWLQRQKNNFDADTLTREAAYNIEQVVRSYHIKVSREAKAKHRYGTPESTAGFTSCTVHANAGTSEIYRIGDLVINELNKGNYNMVGTGLNPYASRDER